MYSLFEEKYTLDDCYYNIQKKHKYFSRLSFATLAFHCELSTYTGVIAEDLKFDKLYEIDSLKEFKAFYQRLEDSNPYYKGLFMHMFDPKANFDLEVFKDMIYNIGCVDVYEEKFDDEIVDLLSSIFSKLSAEESNTDKTEFIYGHFVVDLLANENTKDKSLLETYGVSSIDDIGFLNKHCEFKSIEVYEENFYQYFDSMFYFLMTRNSNNPDILSPHNQSSYDLDLGKKDIVFSSPFLNRSKDTHFEIDIKQYPLFADIKNFPKSLRKEYACLIKDLNRLNDEGVMYAVMPYGFLLARDSGKLIIEKLIENNLLETVVELQDRAVTGIKTKFCLLVLRKNREKDDVLFVRQNDFFGGKKEDPNGSINIIKQRKVVDGLSYLASKQEIVDNDYLLSVAKYIDKQEEADEKELLELSEEYHQQVKEEIKQLEKEIIDLEKEIVAKYEKS